MLKLRSVLIALLALLFLTGCAENYAGHEHDGSGYIYEYDYVDETPSDITPLMWHVTSPGGQTMYLFGSIHVGTADIYPLPDFVMDAFHRSDYLAVEFDMLSIVRYMGAMQRLMMYPEGMTVVDDIGEELHERATAFLAENGRPNLHLDGFKPMMWHSTILEVATHRAGLLPRYGLDVFFLQEAVEHDMGILEVESALSQMEIVFGFSMPLQIALLEEALEDIDQAAQELLELYSLWKQGDAQGIRVMLGQDYIQYYIHEDELFAEYWYAMMTRRDIHMAEMARSYMAEGKKVFFVVGLAHFLVDDGVIDLLIQNGYDVVRVQ